MLKYPERESVLQADWIGLEPRLNGWPFEADKWVLWSHEKPMYCPDRLGLPIRFYCGAEGSDAARLLGMLQQAKICKLHQVPNARLAGQRLLDSDLEAARHIQKDFLKTLKSLSPQTWVPRRMKQLRSYWAFPIWERGSSTPHLQFLVAKRPDSQDIMPVPLERFGIKIKGLERRPAVKLETGEP